MNVRISKVLKNQFLDLGTKFKLGNLFDRGLKTMENKMGREVGTKCPGRKTNLQKNHTERPHGVCTREGDAEKTPQF